MMLKIPEFSSATRREKADHLEMERDTAQLIRAIWSGVSVKERSAPDFLEVLVRCSWTTSNSQSGSHLRNKHLARWLSLPSNASSENIANRLASRLRISRPRSTRLIEAQTGIANYYTSHRPAFIKALRRYSKEIAAIFTDASRTTSDSTLKSRKVVASVMRLPEFRTPNGGTTRMLNGLTSALACLDPARKIPIINQRTRDLLRLIGRKADPEGAEALTLLIGQKNIHDAFDLDVYSQSLPLMKPLPRVKKAAHQPRTLGVKSELSVMARYAVRKTAVKRDHNKLTNKFRLAAMWKYIVDEERYDAFIPEWRDGKSLLIEAKTTTEGILGRMLVRQAIGQLFDYRFMHFDHHDKPVELALLTPKKPAADVLDLLKTLNIHSIYFEGKHLRGV